jgi:hypothetical protein
MRGKRRRSTRWAIPHPSRSARSTPVPRRVCALTCCGSPPGGDRRGLPRKRYCRRTRQPTYSSHAAVFLDCVRLPDRAGDSGRARCCSCGGSEPRGGDHRTARAASPLQWLRLCCQPIKWCPCRTSVFRGMLRGSPVWSGGRRVRQPGRRPTHTLRAVPRFVRAPTTRRAVGAPSASDEVHVDTATSAGPSRCGCIRRVEHADGMAAPGL